MPLRVQRLGTIPPEERLPVTLPAGAEDLP